MDSDDSQIPTETESSENELPTDTNHSTAEVATSTDTSEQSSQSIEEMLLEFDEQDGLIRDRSLLDPNYVVEEDRIVGRDKQLQEVTKMLRVALGNNRPPNLFLYGPSGTGKSLIMKAVCKNIHKICESRDIKFGTVEVNCQDLDTLNIAVYELAEQSANEAGVDVEVPKHGVATKEKWDELYRIVNENFDSVVFVLDELDMLVGRRDKQDPAFSRLLYQLSRAGANDDLTAYISVVAISNDTKMMESVGSRALSSFTPEDVHFDDYDARQLQAILRRRQDAFHEGVVDSGVIPLAAAVAAQTHGDARKAIDLMRVAGELAEREGDDGIREEHVRQAQDKVEKNRVLEVVRGISTQKKICLYATAAVAAQTADGAARSTTGYRVYQYLTDAIDVDQYYQETYVNKMKELTTYSLLDFERRSHGPSSGMFLEFQFGEQPETILETLREDSRIDMISNHEVESVVKAQIQNET
ncbi:orc1/cdc6 family replication initiation protein (plasmid) [Halocatena salina]|uniref:ORC1-type DNA replication protein n=2 Tax=Halocatena salina TaxID=2934340 RepID=A0A8U0A8A9_9EURY|nr:orc1/cdc6 family replication initiation protein [Halocatena salina]UPM45089.1 orc1/cdc6 family replication initiation protein [Halocatena salina]